MTNKKKWYWKRQLALCILPLSTSACERVRRLMHLRISGEIAKSGKLWLKAARCDVIDLHQIQFVEPDHSCSFVFASDPHESDTVLANMSSLLFDNSHVNGVCQASERKLTSKNDCITSATCRAIFERLTGISRPVVFAYFCLVYSSLPSNWTAYMNFSIRTADAVGDKSTNL
jgi:hypothetical protein